MGRLISIIIPVYDVEKYLNKCIDSVINQTYENTEIILIDDGSPDKCPEICDEYAKKDRRVKVIHKKNEGLSEARNAGIDIAIGSYISFIDSDDYIESTMIESLYKNIIDNNADLAICNVRYIDEQGKEIKGKNNNTNIKDESLDKDNILNRLCKENGSNYYVIACNKLYKKELFKDLRFPKGKLHEDEFIAHHILDKCQKCSMTSISLYNYVQRSGSIMLSSFTIRRLDGAEAFFDRTKFFIKKQLFDQASFSLLQGIRILKSGYVKLNRRDRQNNKRLKELKKEYNDIYRKIINEKISFEKKVAFTVFYINYRVYLVLAYIYKLFYMKSSS